ncbi:HAMP domain-containing histidine kinase [Cytobacillus spongiae]|jgi:signal transduction histidine kinase|uniref:sensor histidine kinase n=1 Tax=Cytobacillus spongiae TaxID=2901381 RepID=UPI001F3DC24A|nr:HAMP domain-containing sensor histidine kinase [Cytobacillus spongiae]UII54850.1 HAMP domain-containing histidine kinase [Cytobacillus spongiae]
MKSLYVKFVGVTIVIMLVSSILAFLLSNAYYQQKLKPLNDQKNTKIALSISTFLKNHSEINIQDYLEHTSTIGYQVYLVDSDQNESFFGAEFNQKSLKISTVEEVLNGHVYHGIRNFPNQTFVTGFFANDLENTIGVPLTYQGKNYALFIRPDIKLLFNEMHYLFGWILLLSILISILLVIIGTKYLVQPISKLTKATKLLADGQFRVDISVNRQDELGELARSFVSMSNKLEKTDEMRKEFISNISHDIQSPLSNIQGYTNLLENDSISKEQRQQFLSIIKGESKRLSILTKQLLMLASLDRNEKILDKRCVNISSQLRELAYMYQWAINEKGIMLSCSLPKVEIVGDPALLNAVWDNLLSNAIKYNDLNGNIDISIEHNGEWVSVTFEDTGIGMRPSELDRIFDRFYRADMARTRTVEGSGLGLSIVSTIVHLHNGKMSVKSREQEGSTFVVELPIK